MSGLPVNPVSCVELCSLQYITKDLRRNFVEEASLMLLEPHSELITRKVIGHNEDERNRDVKITSRWKKLVQESHDIFNPLGMPVDRDTVHHIELLPNAKPHYRRQYRMSAPESAEVRR